MGPSLIIPEVLRIFVSRAHHEAPETSVGTAPPSPTFSKVTDVIGSLIKRLDDLEKRISSIDITHILERVESLEERLRSNQVSVGGGESSSSSVGGALQRAVERSRSNRRRGRAREDASVIVDIPDVGEGDEI